MEITRKNFKKERQEFLAHLRDASLVSIELQTTGTRSELRNETDLPFESFLKSFNASNRYSIIQLGICLFKVREPAESNANVDCDFLNPGAEIEALPYTFFLFPRTYDGSMKREVGMDLLHSEEQGGLIDWNKWIGGGVGYCDEEERRYLKEIVLHGKSKSKSFTVNNLIL